MKTKKQLTWINAGIFPGTIMFSYMYSYDGMITYCKRFKDDTWHIALKDDKELWESSNYLASKRLLELGKKQVSYYIIKITERFTFTDYEYTKLGHEVLHICQFMLPDFLNRNEEYECECYFHSYLMMQCLNVIRGKL